MAAAIAAGAAAEPPRRVTSVVRADARSGRLVRSVTVAPRDVTPRAPGAAARPAAERIPLGEMIDKAAREYGVDPLLVHAVIQVESGYNPFAVSPKGAQGLMQLIPSTASRLGVKNTFDAEQNIRAGVRHLRQLQEIYKDTRLALAAYNAGEAAVSRYGRVPPYAETENYVIQVGQRWGNARRVAQPAAKRPNEEASEQASREPEHRPVEYFVDSEGRLHMRTR